MNQPEPSTPNVALLRQTMDAILAHPEKHDQTWWVVATECGTAYCFAGWSCVLSGSTITLPRGDTLGEQVDADDGTAMDGPYIAALAMERLGLDEATADRLFAPSNSTADLKHYVDQIAEHGRIVEPIERGER